jgi:hypothetical protein
MFVILCTHRSSHQQEYSVTLQNYIEVALGTTTVLLTGIFETPQNISARYRRLQRYLLTEVFIFSEVFHSTLDCNGKEPEPGFGTNVTGI